jgi:hypothetical protein
MLDSSRKISGKCFERFKRFYQLDKYLSFQNKYLSFRSQLLLKNFYLYEFKAGSHGGLKKISMKSEWLQISFGKNLREQLFYGSLSWHPRVDFQIWK